MARRKRRTGAPGAVGRLRRRAEFLALAAGRRKWAGQGLVLQMRAHDAQQHPAEGEPQMRLGLTASRKVGNAVARNRARRRLRALAREVLPQAATPGHDVVLIAREATVSLPFAVLRDELLRGLGRLKARRPPPDPSGS